MRWYSLPACWHSLPAWWHSFGFGLDVDRIWFLSAAPKQAPKQGLVRQPTRGQPGADQGPTRGRNPPKPGADTSGPWFWKVGPLVFRVWPLVGPWFLGFGPWVGPWFLGFGPWFLGFGPWVGPWFLRFGPWFGPWTLVFRPSAPGLELQIQGPDH